MALNFPANPTDGQVYESYTYDAAKGVWKKTVAAVTLNAISDVNVPSPSEGDIIIYTTDGNVWVNEPLNSDIVTEGTLNLYYTNERVEDFIVEEVSATLPATFDDETLTIGVDQDEFTHISTLEYADFDIDTTATSGTGRLFWNKDQETLSIGLNENVTLQAGQEHLIRVKNASNTTAIGEGKVVMFAGAQGDTVSVSPAISDGTVNHEYLVGITTEEIDPEGFGFVTQFGFVNGIKTNYSGWELGSLLYADPANPGELTHVEPQAPTWHKPIAAVTFVNANAGRILVRAFTGETLNELHNVNVAGASDGDALIFNTTSNTWVAGSVTIDSTDEVSEGTTNLYFTDQRAIDAVKDNIELDDLSDVDVSTANDGDALVFDTVTTSWVPGSIAIDSIGDISDVDINTPADGEVLVYDTTTTSWVNKEVSAGIKDITTTTSSRALTLDDIDDLVLVDSSSEVSITIPANSTVSIPVKSQINIVQAGDSTVELVGDSGVVVNSSSGLKTRDKWSVATAIKTGEDEWLITGDLSE
jgi:hypothetical protein